MSYKKLITLTGTGLLIIITAISVMAQSSVDLRINEVLVINESNYVDDFGEKSPWIEIFNTAYNSVDIGGLYLTDDLSDPTKYPIAKGQTLTRIPQRSYIVFWADNKPTHGILHLNFTLQPGKTIALFDTNGRTLIDSLTIPHSVLPDVSYGRTTDGGEVWRNLSKTTPNSNNETEPAITSGERFLKYDPTGAGMAMISMGVVFLALAALYLLFKLTSRLLAVDISKVKSRVSARRRGEVRIEDGDSEKTGVPITGEINAAIAMTLYLYSSQLHDAENTILTINKVSRSYSPWSSKIYGLRKLPK